MDYIETNIYNFRELLNDSIVTFEYKKKDGTIRTARGSICKKLIQNMFPHNGDEIKLEKKIVDLIIKLHDYENIFDYALENEVIFETEDDDYYYFYPKKRMKTPNENQTCYFDLDKNQSRSFLNENFLGITKIERLCLQEDNTIESINLEDIQTML